MENSSTLKEQIFIEEFKAMHNQILERARVQQSVLNATTTLAVAVLTVIFAYILPSAISQNDFVYLEYFLLIIAIPFYLFIQSYSLSNIMIVGTASYIHSVLRPLIVKETNDTNVLLNEFWFKVIRDKRAGFKHTILRIPLLMLFFPVTMTGFYIVLFIRNFYQIIDSSNIYAECLLLIINLYFVIKSILTIVEGDKNLREIINIESRIRTNTSNLHD